MAETKPKKAAAKPENDAWDEALASKKSSGKGMKFAVIKTGGKQYVVEPGKTITIEKIGGASLKKGDAVTFDEVLMIEDDKGLQIGMPLVSGASVKATLADAGRARKLTVINFKRKSRYTRKQGHRQPFMKVKIS